MNRSTAAFLIASLFHLLLILIFILLARNIHIISHEKQKENRIKISLKELPKPIEKKDAGLIKKKEPDIAPPMPKGKQLKKIVQKPFKKYVPKKTVKEVHKITINKPEKPVHKTVFKPKAPAPLPKKPFIEVARSNDENKTVIKKKETKKHSKLYSFLSKEVPDGEKGSNTKQTRRSSEINQDIKELYGSEFGELSAGEQKYILDNTEIMRRITQQVLNRVGRVNIPNDLRVNRINIIEFYLHPNGDMTDFRFIKKSGFYILDDTTKETIEYAYSKYPRPAQKTLIRYKVGYYLRGY
ncbi:hypothetical protein [Sulfurimonas sp. HSL-1716]|uniref:hypothetical protein n=1 Tax=Hydrocurvibacter sulfurireducens TaxID=3131937 RepID=UPI0031F82851